MNESYPEKLIRSLSAPLRPQPTGVAPRLTRLPGIRAVLFDIYGTLFISGSGDVGTADTGRHGAAFATVLREAGLCTEKESQRLATEGPAALETAILAEHQRLKKNGIATPEIDILTIWQRVLDAFYSDGVLGTAPSEDPATLKRIAISYECRTNPVWPMPGLTACITSLRQRGMILGIVSNAQFYTPLLFRPFLKKNHEEMGFDPEFCAWSYRTQHAKPSKQMFTTVLERLKARFGIAAHNVVYVGNDVRNDIAPAAEVGMHTALFAGDARSLRLRDNDPLYANSKPDLVLTELQQLPHCLTRRNETDN